MINIKTVANKAEKTILDFIESLHILFGMTMELNSNKDLINALYNERRHL